MLDTDVSHMTIIHHRAFHIRKAKFNTDVTSDNHVSFEVLRYNQVAPEWVNPPSISLVWMTSKRLPSPSIICSGRGSVE